MFYRVAKLTDCFNSCTPRVEPSSDPLRIKYLQMLQDLTNIFRTLKENHCEVHEGEKQSWGLYKENNGTA